MLDQIGDMLVSRLLLEPQLEEIGATVTLKPLNARRFAQPTPPARPASSPAPARTA